MGDHNISWQCIFILESPFLLPPALYATKEKKAAETLAAHPLQARPVRVEERIPWKAADVVEAPVGAPVLDQRGASPLADASGGLPAPDAILARPEARPVAAGTLLAPVPKALDQLPISAVSGSLVERASRKIVAEGALVTSWSPVMLKNELENYLLRGGKHIGLKQVWDDLAKYLYLPRVRDEEVLKATVQDGVRSEDYFGYATSVTASGHYEGLKFGDADAVIYLDEQSVLVRPDVARRQAEEVERKRGTGPSGYAPVGGGEGTANEGGGEWSETGGSGEILTHPEPPTALPRRFYGVVEVDPVRLGGNASQISQEIVQHLVAIMGADVEITMEIKADVPVGVPEHVKHIVSENCRTLRFRDFRFERE